MDMTIEVNRIKSFDELPTRFNLARAGFYRLCDVIVCAFCGIALDEKDVDNPVPAHIKASPNCKYNTTEDVCGIRDMDELKSIPKAELDEIIYPKFKSVESRLASFKNWPISINQKPKTFAEAGFYYTGTGDHTVCFYCGIGIKAWDKDDDVLDEHEKHSPFCTYVKLKTEKSEIENAKSVKCKICYNSDINILLFPCKHASSCIDCSMNFKDCPICKTKITKRLKIFLN